MTIEDRKSKISRIFQDHFGTPPTIIARAPGRVNLIGEHTDYNDGFVFPAAIDRDVYVAARATGDGRARLYAANLRPQTEFPPPAVRHHPSEHWSHHDP